MASVLQGSVTLEDYDQGRGPTRRFLSAYEASGTGAITTAHKAGVVKDKHLKVAIANMLTLNRTASQLFRQVGFEPVPILPVSIAGACFGNGRSER